MNALTSIVPARIARSAETEAAVRALGGELLTMADLIAFTGLHRATIYRLIAAGTFPAGKHTGANSRRWTRAEITAWVQARE